MNIITKAVMAIVVVMALTIISASAEDNFGGLYTGITTRYSNFGSDTLNGIRGGVGVDQFITDSLFVRLEGSYADFARLGGSESDQYRVTIGLGYKF